MMIKVIPYLLVSNAKKAIESYKQIFDAKVIVHKKFNAEIGKKMGFPENYDYENSTMHAKIEIGGSAIYLADNNQRTKDYGHVEITLEFETEEQISKCYQKAIENECKSKMELTESPSLWYARIIDKFGVGWQLNYVPENKE